MKAALVAIIIRDKSRMLTLAVAVAMAVTGSVLTRLAIRIDPETNALLIAVFTALFGWLIEAFASEANAKGVGQIQSALSSLDPSLVQDRSAGVETVEAVRDAVKAAQNPGKR